MALDSETLFIHTPPARLFLKAALPGSISMLLSSLYQLFDGIMVGQFVGATGFAAVNLAMPFVIINFAVADLIGVGASVPISVALGRGDRDEANNIFTCAVLLIVSSGAVVGAALYLLAPTFISLMARPGSSRRRRSRTCASTPCSRPSPPFCSRSITSCVSAATSRAASA